MVQVLHHYGKRVRRKVEAPHDYSIAARCCRPPHVCYRIDGDLTRFFVRQNHSLRARRSVALPICTTGSIIKSDPDGYESTIHPALFRSYRQQMRWV